MPPVRIAPHGTALLVFPKNWTVEAEEVTPHLRLMFYREELRFFSTLSISG